jgi:hypothetical protein
LEVPVFFSLMRAWLVSVSLELPGSERITKGASAMTVADAPENSILYL